jgi:hypothetical protein
MHPRLLPPEASETARAAALTAMERDHVLNNCAHFANRFRQLFGMDLWR